jgi:tetratricopeptide (TPR) repeat protein
MRSVPLVPPVLGAGLLLLTACATTPVRYVSVVPPTAQALSLLGDTLWSLPLAPDEGQWRVRDLFAARQRVADRPHSSSAQLLLARRTADLGRFREAVAILTEAMAEHPTDLRVSRRRGEVLLRIREFDQAVDDLSRAARGALERNLELEYNETDEGNALVGSSLQYSALFYLGMAYYLRGDFTEARQMLGEALKRANHADEVVSATLWLFFATRRLGLHTEALRTLAAVPPDLPVETALAQYQLLLGYRGEVPQDSLLLSIEGSLTSAEQAMYGYGIGFVFLMLGRREEAALLFHRVRATSDWSALPYIAAEAELARMTPDA